MRSRRSDDVLRSVFGASTEVRSFTPEVDLRIDGDALRLVLDVPGVPLSALAVEVHEGVLTVSGERRYEAGSGREQVILGRRYGRFRMRFELPEWVDAETLSARLSDGVLTLEIEKRASARRRKIAVLPGAPVVRALGPKRDDED